MEDLLRATMHYAFGAFVILIVISVQLSVIMFWLAGSRSRKG